MLLYQYLLTGWCEHTHNGSHDRMFALLPIALMHVPLSDHLTTRTMLSLVRTTLAFAAQRVQQDVRRIAYHCTTLV